MKKNMPNLPIRYHIPDFGKIILNGFIKYVELIKIKQKYEQKLYSPEATVEHYYGIRLPE